ncbi:MAG: hypothetical protein DWI58_09150 [Chloroflexi bacterium]|nr:MAG: hypothetical protein DWI58_09150 [Chloroflexota bacterium]
MDQWEYRVAYVDSRGRISCEGVEFIRQSGEHRTTFASRYLSALGRDGWSLSGIQHLGRSETAYFVLQRPLTATAAAGAAEAGTPA